MVGEPAQVSMKSFDNADRFVKETFRKAKKSLERQKSLERKKSGSTFKSYRKNDRMSDMNG